MRRDQDGYDDDIEMMSVKRTTKQEDDRIHSTLDVETSANAWATEWSMQSLRGDLLVM